MLCDGWMQMYSMALTCSGFTHLPILCCFSLMGEKAEANSLSLWVRGRVTLITSSLSQGQHTETTIHPHIHTWGQFRVTNSFPRMDVGATWGRKLIEKDSDRDPFWWKVTALTIATGCFFFKKQINNFHNKICLDSCPSFEDPRQRHHSLKQRF